MNRTLKPLMPAWQKLHHSPEMVRLAAEAAELIAPAEGDMFLELACGSGRLSRALLGRGARVVGLDPSPELIELAAKSDDQALYHVLAEAELDYPDNYFTTVVSLLGTALTADITDWLNEAGRVVQPGGRLIVGALSETSPLRERFDVTRHTHTVPDLIRRMEQLNNQANRQSFAVGSIDELAGGLGVFIIQWIKSMTI